MSFNPSYSGLGELLRSEEMQDAMRPFVERGAEFARSIAPVDDGDYKAAIRTSVGVRRTQATERAEGRIEVDVPHAIFVEYGTSNGSPAQHILGRALDAMKE